MIRLKTLLREQQDNPFAATVRRRKTASTTTTRPETTPAPSPDTKPAPKKDVGRIESIFQKISDNFIAIYDEIEQLYENENFWKPFKGSWNDDEEAAVAVVFGSYTNEPGTWWFKNIQSIINSIESDFPELDEIIANLGSPLKAQRQFVMAEKNLKIANNLYKELKKKTLGDRGTDKLQWLYYGGITDSDTNKLYKVDTDF